MRSFLACALVCLALFALLAEVALPVLAQGRPDILWMQGHNYYTAADGLAFFPMTLNNVPVPPAEQKFAAHSHRAIKIRRLTDGQTLKTIATGSDTWHIDVSSDGLYIVSGGDTVVKLWNVETGALIWSQPYGGTDGVIFSPDGNYIATSAGGSGFLLRRIDGSIIRSFGPMYAFSPDSQTVLAMTGGGGVFAYRTSDGAILGNYGTSAVAPLAVSADGTRTAIRRYDFTYGSYYVDISFTSAPSKRMPFDALRGCFSPDGLLFYVYDTPGAVDVWDIATATRIRRITLPASSFRSVAIAPDGNSFLYGSSKTTPGGMLGQYLERWSLTDGTLITSYAGHGATTGRVAFSRERNVVVSVAEDGMIYRWHPQTGELLGSIPFGGAAYGVAFSPDDSLLVVTSINDSVVKVYRTSDWSLVRQLGDFANPHLIGYAYDAQISPDNKYVAIAYGYPLYTLKVFPIAGGNALTWTYPAPDRTYNALAYSADGKTLAVTYGTGTSLLNPLSGLVTWSSPYAGYDVAFSPSGKTVAVSGVDNTPRLLDVVNGGALLKSFVGHTDYVMSIAFTPDGGTLVSGANDRTIRFWNASTGAQIKLYDDETGSGTGGAAGVTGLALPCDGHDFAYARNDFNVVVARNPYYKEAPLKSLSLTPANTGGGTTVTGKVTLSWCAPPGGLTVTLGKDVNLPAATVPASVFVPEGQTTATFPIATSPVTATQTGKVSAQLRSVTKTATLTLNPPALSSVAVAPTSVIAGAPANGTVTLTGGATPGGVIVTLTSSQPFVVVPGSVTVPEGESAATFNVATTGVAAAGSATITATFNSVNKTATLTVKPAALSSMTLSPTTVKGGTGSTATVTLTGLAPAGGYKVMLKSGNVAVQVPADVTVPEGQSATTFSVTTSAVTAKVAVALTATPPSGSAKTAKLTVTP